MDAEYLQRTVGESLATALAEVSSVRPADPIEFLALWLLKHTANQREREGSNQQEEDPDATPKSTLVANVQQYRSASTPASTQVPMPRQTADTASTAPVRLVGSTGDIPNPMVASDIPPRSPSMPPMQGGIMVTENIAPPTDVASLRSASMPAAMQGGRATGLSPDTQEAGSAAPRKAASTGDILDTPPASDLPSRSTSLPANLGPTAKAGKGEDDKLETVQEVAGEEEQADEHNGGSQEEVGGEKGKEEERMGGDMEGGQEQEGGEKEGGEEGEEDGGGGEKEEEEREKEGEEGAKEGEEGAKEGEEGAKEGEEGAKEGEEIEEGDEGEKEGDEGEKEGDEGEKEGDEGEKEGEEGEKEGGEEEKGEEEKEVEGEEGQGNGEVPEESN